RTRQPGAGQHAAPNVATEMAEDERSEPTQEHPAPEMEEVEHGVVTSAPDYQGRGRGGRPMEPPRPHVADHSVRDGGVFDPFKGLDVEPPASESVSHPPPPPSAPGPRLLAPERRKHSDTEETAVLDKKALRQQAGIGNADATLETADPFSATPDPFSATPDPFAPAPEAAERTSS